MAPIYNRGGTCKPRFYVAFIATALSVLVAMLSVYSRFTDAGFDCSERLDCDNGFFTITKQSSAFAHYFSAVGWAELAHQLSLFILLCLVIWLAVSSWALRKDCNYSLKLPVFILFLVLWQLMFGMWFINLVLWPQIALINFLSGMAICALLWLLALRLDGKYWEVSKKNVHKLGQIKPWVILAIIIILIEIALGGWTRVKFAAFACPDFPFCQNKWWPEMSLKRGFDLIQPFGIEALESKSRVAINVIHRVGALITTIYLLGLAAFLLTIRDHRVQRMGLILCIILIGQLVFVVTAGYVRDSVFSSIVHNFGSILILLVLISLVSRVVSAKQK